ncbi:MAG TPA: RNA-binding cell elongation regulator Jag/EloR [Candidatus Binataceae bacterium]|nr:RNA-binding cell elongation regulator Jag/EloR [Candidatus Binataceae bacterium]
MTSSEPSDSIEIAAATVEAAIEEALGKLGAAHDDVVIEVLSTSRAGVLGLGARQARVRVSRRTHGEARSGVMSPPPAPPLPPRAAAPRPQPTTRSAPVSQPPLAAPSEAVHPIPEATRESPATRDQPSPRHQMRPEQEPPRRHTPARHEPPSRYEMAPEETAGHTDARRARPAEERPETHEADPSDAALPTAPIEDQVRDATALVRQILERMGENTEVRTMEEDSEGIELEIKGDGSGLLIGRHGQTLDALEYVVNRILARRVHDAIPITLDTEAYRERRRRQLHRMALTMGEQAKRDHAAVTLEAMAPRDRRIVHLALKDDPMLTTRSSGEGFLRTIEIIPVGERRDRVSGGATSGVPAGSPPPGAPGDRRTGGSGENPGGGERRNNRGGRGRNRGRGRGGDQREKQADPKQPEAPPIGEQGGFKHGQKRLF